MKLQVITTRVLPKDVVELKRRATAAGMPWQTYLRQLLHEALSPTRETATRRVIR